MFIGTIIMSLSLTQYLRHCFDHAGWEEPVTRAVTIVRTHTYIAHTDRNGYSAVLVADVPYPGKAIRISNKGQ